MQLPRISKPLLGRRALLRQRFTNKKTTLERPSLLSAYVSGMMPSMPKRAHGLPASPKPWNWDDFMPTSPYSPWMRSSSQRSREPIGESPRVLDRASPRPPDRRWASSRPTAGRFPGIKPQRKTRAQKEASEGFATRLRRTMTKTRAPPAPRVTFVGPR